MPHPRLGEPTQLGAAMRAKRGDLALEALGVQLGVSMSTLSRIERGTHEPSTKTALALARWLGWSVEQVLEATNQYLTE